MTLSEARSLVIELFEDNDVVLLGEEHGIADNLQFVSELIPSLVDNGVRNIALEFSAEEYQFQSDELLASQHYNPSIARDMLFGYNVGWPYLEYQFVHHAAWKFNKTHEEKVRLVHPSYRYDWSRWTGARTPECMRLVMHRGNYNVFRAQRIRESISAGGKLLGLFGVVHAFHDTRNLERFNLGGDFLSLGMLLKQDFGMRVASLSLNNDLQGYWDGNLTTSRELRRCTVDRDFLIGKDFSEVVSRWPDPDWTPAPLTVEEYWEIIHSR